MKRICVLLLALFCAVSSLAEESLKTAADALQSAAGLDEQLALLDDLSVAHSRELENGGWDVNLTLQPIDGSMISLIPDVESAEDAAALPDALQRAKFIALYRYGSDGAPSLLGDFQVRLPQANRASSLDEADAVLLLTERLAARDDYVGSASNRVYEVFAAPLGGRAIRLYEKTTTPPVMGTGTLTGEKIPLEALWRYVQPAFYGAEMVVEYPQGTASFRITGDGCCMTGLEGDFTHFEIPQTVNGYPVVGVEKIQCDALETLTLPEGMIYISGDFAINCKNLSSMNFPSTLKRVTGNHAISNNIPLTALELNEGLEEIGVASIIGGSSLLKVHIPSTLTEMAQSFLNQGAHCLWLVIPDGVTALHRRFLWVNGWVQYVYVPASVTSFGEQIMDDEAVRIYSPEGSAAARWAAANGHEYVACGRPEDMPRPEVEYSGDLAYYVDENNEAVLLSYSGDEEVVVVPDELGGCPVVSIYDSAFNQLDSLRSVHLPESVRKLYPYAFSYCDRLEAVYTTVEEMDNHAFYHCPNCTVHAPEDGK